MLNSLDSLQREITRRILSDADKKELRACDREKSQFLKECRASDTAQARVDRQITEAKLSGADPNDPAVAALLERKFSFEKGCDDRYTATPRGKQCLAGEGKRRAALEKALKRDKPYQALLKKMRPRAPNRYRRSVVSLCLTAALAILNPDRGKWVGWSLEESGSPEASGGKSGHRRTGCWLTARPGNGMESATENIPPESGARREPGLLNIPGASPDFR